MIKLIVLDIDGCLSDGKIIYSQDLVETKNFNVKDGLGISSWLKLGNHIAIITGRKSKIVEKRARELGVNHLFQAIDDKQTILLTLLEQLNISLEEVAIIGDDLNDYNMLKLVKKSFTPADGVDDIKKLVNTILNKKGGDGAVREMIDILVDENNQRDQFISLWTDIK